MKEQDIRPQALFNRYLELAAGDVERFFSKTADFVEVNCPACAGTSSHLAFEKLSFGYRLCEDCASLFVSPRPTPSMINTYYRDGASVHFWATDFFKQTADARRVRIFRPRALFVEEWSRKINPNGKRFADIGSGYGIFLDETQALNIFDDVIGIEPSPPLAAVCRERGFTIVEDTIEQCHLDGPSPSVMTSFEFLEHAFDPSEFLGAVRKLLAPGGLLIFTTLTVSGFDIQVLWEHSKSAHPPQHLNLLSSRVFGR